MTAKILEDDPGLSNNGETSPRRVPLNFQRLLDIIVDRSAKESEVIDRLITSPHRICAFAAPYAFYQKVVLYVESSDGGLLGGVWFDGSDHQVYDVTRKTELDAAVATAHMQRITSKQLAENWITNKISSNAHHKLQQQWLTAFLAPTNK